MINLGRYREDPNEWEAWINLLLKTAYRERYTEIPAEDRGDKGLEGYTDCGKAYQSYCPQVSDMATWKKGVKKKIRTDLGKLQKNKEFFESIFNNDQIQSWHLMIPDRRSSELLPYCKDWSKKVLDWGLSFIHGDFKVTTETDSTYEKEKRALLNSRLFSMHFQIDQPTNEEAENLIADDGKFYSELIRKIRAMVPLGSVHSRRDWATSYVRHHVHGQNCLDKIQQDWPEMFNEIINSKNQREAYLIEATGGGMDPHSVIKKVQEDYSLDLQDIMPEGSRQVIQSLVHEAIADWLIRCNLDFKEII